MDKLAQNNTTDNYLLNESFLATAHSENSSSSSSSASSNELSPWELSATTNRKGQKIFGGTLVDDLEQVFEDASPQLQYIVKHLKNSEATTPSYRSHYFIGEPGSGKSTLAAAIAYKIKDARWKSMYLVSNHLFEKYRQQTAIKLRTLLGAIEKDTTLQPLNLQSKRLLIIDEFNDLVDHSERPEYDTKATAETFWSFLDKNGLNQNFFFIGLMNNADHLPPQIKDRLKEEYSLFENVQDLEKKIKIFMTGLKSYSIKIDETALPHLSYLLEKATNLSIRNIKKIITQLDVLCLQEGQEESAKSIQQSHLDILFARHACANAFLKCGQKIESNEDRRARENLEKQEQWRKEDQQRQIAQQQESMAFNKELAEDNKRTQAEWRKEDHALQEAQHQRQTEQQQEMMAFNKELAEDGKKFQLEHSKANLEAQIKVSKGTQSSTSPASTLTLGATGGLGFMGLANVQGSVQFSPGIFSSSSQQTLSAEAEQECLRPLEALLTRTQNQHNIQVPKTNFTKEASSLVGQYILNAQKTPYYSTIVLKKKADEIIKEAKAVNPFLIKSELGTKLKNNINNPDAISSLMTQLTKELQCLSALDKKLGELLADLIGPDKSSLSHIIIPERNALYNEIKQAQNKAKKDHHELFQYDMFLYRSHSSAIEASSYSCLIQ